MIQLILVDDHHSLRVALAALLAREEDIEIVGQAGTLEQARELVCTTTFDTALIDITLPDGSGLDLIPFIEKHHPQCAVIILTGATHPSMRALAIAAGAVGFLSKTADVAEIIAALRRVHDGYPLITPVEAMRLVHQAADLRMHADAADVALAHLSARELDVLRGLGAGLDNQAIADHLNLGVNTVRTHVTHVLSKLGVHSRVQAALIAVRHGLTDSDVTTL